MRLIGRVRLASLAKEDADTARWVASWMVELQDANWKRSSDILGHFPKVIQKNNGTFVFPVSHHKIGIHVLITFPQSLVLIVAIRVLEVTNGH